MVCSCNEILLALVTGPWNSTFCPLSEVLLIQFFWYLEFTFPGIIMRVCVAFQIFFELSFRQVFEWAVSTSDAFTCSVLKTPFLVAPFGTDVLIPVWL